MPSQNAIRTILLTLLRQLANFKVNSKFQTLFHLFDFSLFSSQFFVFRLIYFVSIWFPTCFYFFCFQVHDRWPRTEAQERDEGQVHHREGQTQESAKSGSLEKGRAHRVGVRKQRPGLLFYQQFLIGLTFVKDLAVSLKVSFFFFGVPHLATFISFSTLRLHYPMKLWIISHLFAL